MVPPWPAILLPTFNHKPQGLNLSVWRSPRFDQEMGSKGYPEPEPFDFQLGGEREMSQTAEPATTLPSAGSAKEGAQRGERACGF